MKFSEYTIKNTGEVFDILKTSEKGISSKDANERLKKYGLNEVRGKETTLIDIF